MTLHTASCPLCGAAFTASDRGPNNGWEAAWLRTVAHLVSTHRMPRLRAERVFAVSGGVERNDRAS